MGHHASDTRPLHADWPFVQVWYSGQWPTGLFTRSRGSAGTFCSAVVISCLLYECVYFTETRGGERGMANVANGDTKSTNEIGPSLVGSLGLSCWYKRFLFWLDCSCRPSTKYFFLTVHSFHFICPRRPESWAGSRAGSPVS